MEPCSWCGGYGLVNNGEDVCDCSRCGGGGMVEARDAKGRFKPWQIVGWYDPEADEDS